jgi:hypothetical protein
MSWMRTFGLFRIRINFWNYESFRQFRKIPWMKDRPIVWPLPARGHMYMYRKEYNKELDQLVVSVGIHVRLKWTDHTAIWCIGWNTKWSILPWLNQSVASCSVNYQIYTSFYCQQCFVFRVKLLWTLYEYKWYTVTGYRSRGRSA